MTVEISICFQEATSTMIERPLIVFESIRCEKMLGARTPAYEEPTTSPPPQVKTKARRIEESLQWFTHLQLHRPIVFVDWSHIKPSMRVFAPLVTVDVCVAAPLLISGARQNPARKSRGTKMLYVTTLKFTVNVNGYLHELWPFRTQPGGTTLYPFMILCPPCICELCFDSSLTCW